MRQAKGRLILLALAWVPVAAVAQLERAPVPPWFVEINGGAVFASSDQPADNAGLIGLRGGANFTTTWSLEAEWSRDERTFDAGFDLQHTSFAINFVQHNRTPLWNPYFLLGLGALRFELPDDSDTQLAVHVGVGGQWDLSTRGHLLRVEARYRYADLGSSQLAVLERGEPVLTVGLVFPLGR